MTLPPLREKRTVRVLRIIGFFTLEDLRWMQRVQRECRYLEFEPPGYFRRLELAIIRALQGHPISPQDKADLIIFIQGDRHWTKLFRDKVMPNYPVIRATNKIISGRLTGGEMYYQWDPHEFFADLESHTRRNGPLFEVWPHYTIPFEWRTPTSTVFTEEELEILRFYGEADLDYVFRFPPLPGLKTNFPLTRDQIMAEIKLSPNDMSIEATELLASMFGNDVVIWRIVEDKLGRLVPVSNLVWWWGREVYESEELKSITEKLLGRMESF